LNFIIPGSGFWAQMLFAAIGSGVSTIVNGGTFASFAIGMGIGLAAGLAAGAIVGSTFNVQLNGTSTWANFMAHPIETVAQGALAGALSGAANSAVYGGKTWDAVGEGALGGVTGVGVALGTEAALSPFVTNSVANGGGGKTLKEINKDMPVIQACAFTAEDRGVIVGDSYEEIDDFVVHPAEQRLVDINTGKLPAISSPNPLDWIFELIYHEAYLKPAYELVGNQLQNVQNIQGAKINGGWVAEMKLDKYVFHEGFLGIGRGYKPDGSYRWEQMRGGPGFVPGMESADGKPIYSNYLDAYRAGRHFALWNDFPRTDHFVKTHGPAF
jgi:hypothetical protein